MSIHSSHASLGKPAAPLHLPLLVPPVPQAITRGHGTQQWSGGTPRLLCVHWYFLHPLPPLCFSFRKQVAFSTEKATYLRHKNPPLQTTWSEPASLVTRPLCSVQTTAAEAPAAPASCPAGPQQTSLRAQAGLAQSHAAVGWWAAQPAAAQGHHLPASPGCGDRAGDACRTACVRSHMLLAH